MATQVPAAERDAVLNRFAYELSAASELIEAARLMARAAEELIGLDSCLLEVWDDELREFFFIFGTDLLDGKHSEVPWPSPRRPSPVISEVAEKGALIILRHGDPVDTTRHLAFGDTSRRSASLLFVPMRRGPKAFGVFSAQSYTPDAYTEGDLTTLQALADHGASAFARIRAHEQVRMSEERFSAVFHAGVAAIGIASLADGRYLDVNQRWLDLLGFTREEAVGRTSVELNIWPQPGDRAQFAAQLRARGSLREWRCRWVRKDGRQIDALSSFERLKIGGEDYVISITQDITEQLHLEAQLRQAQKMESIGQLAAGVAHDFNNILTVISGNTDLILEGDLDTDVARSALSDIQLAAERAAGLTRQLLTFSRRQILQRRDLDLNEVIGNVTRLLMRVLGEHIELNTHFTPGLPRLHADPGMLEQVVMNLAVNARDAMPKGGCLTLRTETMQPDTDFLRHRPEARRGRFIILTVTDTGTGIAPEDLPHLFEPFFTTKEVGKGTGLGLATVYGIAKQHEGWVEVDSELGRGATFRIYLPVAEKSATSGHHATPARPLGGGGEHIFLAEDEPMVRSLTEQILRFHGYVVTSACNGVEAIKLWRAGNGAFDLLLTDMVMPLGVTGSELAAELRRSQPDLKVLFMSGYSREIADPNLILDSRTRFLQKPFLPDALLHALRESLHGVTK